MPSQLFKLNKDDFIRGATTAIFTAIVAVLWGASQQPDFSILSLDWASVLNAAVYGFIGYLGKNFVSDKDGAVFGRYGGAKGDTELK